MTTPVDLRTRLTQAWKWILAGACVGLLLGAVLGLTRTASYTSTVTGMVVPDAGKSVTDAAAGQQLALAKAQVYASIGGSTAVAQEASAKLSNHPDPATLNDKVTVNAAADVPSVTVSASDSSPTAARDLATAWLSALRDQAAKIDASSNSNLIQIVPLGQASMPTAADQPTRPIIVGLFTVLGALAGMALGLLFGRRASRRGIRRAHRDHPETDQPSA